MFDSIKKQLEEQLKKIEKLDRKVLIGGIVGGIVGITVLGVGAYFLFRKNKTTAPIVELNTAMAKSTKTADESNQGDDLFESGQRTFIRVVNSLKKIISEDRAIDFEGLKAIYKAQYQLSRKEFKALTLSSREKRRKVLQNLEEYNKLLSSYVIDIDGIHNKHLTTLQAHFKIDEVEWVQLTEEAANQFPDDWDAFILANDTEELDSIRDPSKPKIKLQTLIDIEKFRIAQLKEKMESFRTTFAELDPTDIYELVEKWGRDVVYNKFKVEEEDIQYSISQLNDNDKERLETHQEELRTVMESLIMDSDYDQDEEEDEEEK